MNPAVRHTGWARNMPMDVAMEITGTRFVFAHQMLDAETPETSGGGMHAIAKVFLMYSAAKCTGGTSHYR